MSPVVVACSGMDGAGAIIFVSSEGEGMTGGTPRGRGGGPTPGAGPGTGIGAGTELEATGRGCGSAPCPIGAIGAEFTSAAAIVAAAGASVVGGPPASSLAFSWAASFSSCSLRSSASFFSLSLRSSLSFLSSSVSGRVNRAGTPWAASSPRPTHVPVSWLNLNSPATSVWISLNA